MNDCTNIQNELEDFEKFVTDKTISYFENENKITKDNFSQYLEYVGLLDFWSTEQEKNYFWGVLEKYSNNNELNLEGALKGINEFFNDDEEQNNDNENNKNDLLNNRISLDNKQNFSNFFDNIEIEKIRELRKLFSLLNLQMRENVSITKIKEILNKYKFIKITEDELFQFLELIFNTDKNKLNNENQNLTINFELYSKIMSLMEQKILENNNNCFRESKSINYEVNEDPIEMTENLINIEKGIYEYLKGIYDIKNVFLDMKEQIISNYDKILLHSKDENEENLKENILTCDDVFNQKIKDFDNFINEIQINSHKKEDKLVYLKHSIFELKNEYQNLQNDYMNIQQNNLNEKNDLIEMNEQINKLIQENKIINEQYENRKYEIKKLKKELNDKDNEFNLFKIQYKEILNENKNKINEIENLKIDNKNLKSNYDQLINEIYVKINQENERNKTNLEIKRNTNFESDLNIHISEENKKLYPSNYDKLLIYTSELDKTNQELNDKINSLTEIISKKEEKLLNIKNELNKEKESNIILKSQNIKLQDKIEDLNKDIEINQLFRPSKMLNQFRLSRLSNLNNNNLRNSNLLFINPNKIKEKVNNPFENNNNNENKTKQIKLSETKIDSIIYNNNKFNNKDIEINKNENENKQEIQLDKKLLEKNPAVIIIPAKKKMISEKISTEKKKYNYFEIDRIEVNIKKDEITKENYISIKYFKDILNNENETLKTNLLNEKINENNYFDGNIKQNNNLIDALNNNINIENLFNKNEDNSNKNISNFIEEQNNISINENIIDMNNKLKLDKKSESFISSKTSDNILYQNIDNISPNESYSFSRPINNILDIEKKDSNLSNSHSHIRNKTIENIDEILEEKNIPKISSYDFLSLRQSKEIILLLDKYNDNSTSYETFSDNIFLINGNYEKNKFILYITSNYIYILDKISLQPKKIFLRKNLLKLTISIKNCNMIVFHFNGKEDIVIEILRRLELLYYLRDLLNLKGGKLLFKYSDEFNVKMDGLYFTMNVRASINTIAQNFQNSIKFNYLYKLSPGFLNYGRTFKEKFVVLSNVGLLYFDDPSNPPKKLIPINGSEIKKIDENVYKRKYCFEIRCLNKQNYIFAANSENDLNDWLKAFELLKETYLKNKVEGTKN